MKLDYVPLLQLQRELHELPRNYDRFRQYLRVVLGPDGSSVELPSLIVMNPMGKDHVTALLGELLSLDADGIATRAVAAVSDRLADQPGEFQVGLVVADDLLGSWTNRFAAEFTLRFGPDHHRFASDRKNELPRWLKKFWITAVLWSSEAASERAVRDAILTAVFRTAYVQRRGPARTLRDMLAQEGEVAALAGCTAPQLEDDDIAYTREVIAECLDASDMRTCIECLFGDEASRSLGFTPRGLSPWAGLALALHDGRKQHIAASLC